MLVWSGFGFFVAVFICLAYAFCEWLVDSIWQAGYYTSHPWAVGITFVLAGVICFVFVQVLKKHAAQTVPNEPVDSGSIHQSIKHHSLFFIPISYWSFILFLLGAFLCLRDLLT